MGMAELCVRPLAAGATGSLAFPSSWSSSAKGPLGNFATLDAAPIRVKRLVSGKGAASESSGSAYGYAVASVRLYNLAPVRSPTRQREKTSLWYRAKGRFYFITSGDRNNFRYY